MGAFVSMKQPIPFDAPDGQPVSLIFVLLVPDRATDLHLQILSELAQMFSDKPFRERLLAAPTAGGGAPAHQPSGSRMPQVSIARLFEDNREKLRLEWVAGRDGGGEGAEQRAHQGFLARA